MEERRDTHVKMGTKERERERERERASVLKFQKFNDLNDLLSLRCNL